MKRIGLTGGIGSGKTTVSKIFATVGVPVFYADEAGRNVLNEDKEVVRAVIKLLGRSVYTDGRANRKEIANMVFRHPESLDALNAIVHPAVGRAWEQFCEVHQAAAYVLKEAAILFESGSYKGLDAVIAVTAPESVRIKRVMARDAVSADDVRLRMRKQLPEEERNQRADFLVYNAGEKPLLPQVLNLHQTLIA